MSVIVKLMGGLGNQLFQWGFGQALKNRGRNVAYDKSSLIEGTHREYSLDFLDPWLPIAQPWGDIVCEKSHIFDPRMLWIRDKQTASGYFQSEQYMVGLEPDIRSQFNYRWSRTSLSPQALEIQNDLCDNVSCFIHVRRQDYTILQDFHGMPTIEYYLEAAKEISRQHYSVKYYVFSDDKYWCRENFPSDFKVVDGTTKYEDLRLMAGCKHAIIANSSFSWWAAWIGDDQLNRTVIAPKKWFTTPTLDDRDIVPSRWLKR